MSKFTPGPWVIIPGGDEWSSGRIATVEPKPKTMAETNYWTVAEVNYRRDEHEANARLIAAAPDLLKALEMCIDWMGDRRDVSPESIDAWVKGRYAIARAKGVQP